MNPYEELGVNPSATVEEIKAAYLNRAKQTHPDAGGDKEAFQAVALAYRTLADPEKRAYYDQTGCLPDDPNAADPASEVARRLADLLFSLVCGNAHDYTVTDPYEIAAGVLRDSVKARGRELEKLREALARVTLVLERSTAERGTVNAKMLAHMEAKRKKTEEEYNKAVDELRLVEDQLILLEDFQYSLDEDANSGPGFSTYFAPITFGSQG